MGTTNGLHAGRWFGISSNMGMSKRQKGSLAFLALGLSALALDRLVLLPGPAAASAQSAMLSAAPSVDLKMVSQLAEQLLLTSQATQSPLAQSPDVRVLDAFSSLVAITSQPHSEDVPTPSMRVDPGPASRLPNLSAIVLTDSGGYAVLNGRPLGVGASREGYTLIALSSLSATVEMDGVRVTLSLATERHGAQKSP